MAQLARMRKEANVKRQEKSISNESSDPTAVQPTAMSPPMMQSIPHATAANKVAPAAAPTIKEPELNKPSADKSKIEAENVPSTVEPQSASGKVGDQLPSSPNTKSNTDKTKNSRVNQSDDLTRKQTEGEASRKKKKQKRNKKLHIPSTWMDSDARAINETTDDFDDFDSLLRAHEQPAAKPSHTNPKQQEIRKPQREDEASGNLEDLAFKILGRKKPDHDKYKAKRKGGSQTEDGNEPKDTSHRKKYKPEEKKKFEPKLACTYWEAGHCKNGDKCTFSHAGEKGDYKKTQLCRHILTGSCVQGDLCPYSHDTKLMACRHYYVKGICLLGEECAFAHEDATPKAISMMKANNTPCRFYHLKGYCTSGDDCLYSHANQPKERLTRMKESEICKFILSGHCASGDACLYSHDVNSNHSSTASDYTTATANFELKFE